MIVNSDGADLPFGTFKDFDDGAHLFVNGAEFELSYRGGSGSNDVVLTQLSVSPNVARLFIEKTAANQARLSWSTNAIGFQLETAAVLTPANWQPVPAAPAVLGDRFAVTLPSTNGAAFFRLVKP